MNKELLEMVEMEECWECGKIFSADNEGTVYEHHHYCSECYEDNFSTCDACGAMEHNDVLSYLPGVEIYVCEGCYYDYEQCDHCGDYVERGDMLVTSDGESICSGCYEYDYFTCEECGEIHRDCYSVYIEHLGYSVCEDCAEGLVVIKQYGRTEATSFYDGDNKTRWEAEGVRYFGVELEIDNGDDREDLASEILNISSRVELKEDGSLDDGFEIVSQPMSLSSWVNNERLPRILNLAKDYGFISHDAGTCGLHIHVNRSSLGETKDEQQLTQAKLVILIYKYWDSHIVAFSRRKSFGYCEKPSLDSMMSAADIDEKKYEINYRNERKYSALNLAPRNTIEFRFFNGTLLHETFLASIQFVDNIVTLARNTDVSELNSIGWSDIINFNNHAELIAYDNKRQRKYDTTLINNNLFS